MSRVVCGLGITGLGAEIGIGLLQNIVQALAVIHIEEVWMIERKV